MRSSIGGTVVGGAMEESRRESRKRSCPTCGGWARDPKGSAPHRERTPATCSDCLGSGLPKLTVDFSSSKDGGSGANRLPPFVLQLGRGGNYPELDPWDDRVLHQRLDREELIRRALVRVGEGERGAVLVTVLWRWYGPRAPGDPRYWGSETRGEGQSRRYLEFGDYGAIVEYADEVETWRRVLVLEAARARQERAVDALGVEGLWDLRSPSYAVLARGRGCYERDADLEVTRADAAVDLAARGSPGEKDIARGQAEQLLTDACWAYREALRAAR